MNKDELRELFSESLTDLDEFQKDVQRIKDLINLIIENFDLLKDDITDEQIGDISSSINFTSVEIIVLIKDLLSDSKKLESFLHEIKLLKRKREKRLNKDNDINWDKNGKLQKMIERIKKIQPNNTPSSFPPYSTPPSFPPLPMYPPKPNKWDIQF